MKLKKSIGPIVMVKIIWSGLVSAVEGKMGGSKFYNSRGNSIMSKKVRPTNRNSSAQMSVRSAVRYYSALWATGAATFMPEFNAIGAAPSKKNKIGTLKALDGFNWYLLENCRNKFCYNLNYGLATAPASLNVDLTTVPPPTKPTVEGNCKIKTAVGGITPSMTCDIPKIDTGDIFVLYATAPLSPGKSFAKGKYRPIAAFLVHAAQPALDILSFYASEFGNPVSDKKIFFYGEYVSILGSKSDHFVSGPSSSIIAS
jgi:hypothetical protein